MQTADALSAPGDTVIFDFSGHGSQTPDRDGDEPGGQDEILLPMDAKGWKGAVAEVENALTDDALRASAQGLPGRGVQVVGIIDACHSGTGFRAAPGAGRRGWSTRRSLASPTTWRRLPSPTPRP